VLGPATSDGLVGLLREAKAPQWCPLPEGGSGVGGGPVAKAPQWCPLPPAAGSRYPFSTDKELVIDVYPATATATDEQLFRRAGVSPADWGDPNIERVADYIETKLRLRVHRDTPDDGALAGALAKELDARSMRPGLVLRSARELRSWVHTFRKTMIHLVRADADVPASNDGRGRFRHTVLISEWDTAYGRSLPLSVGRELMGSKQPCCSLPGSDPAISQRLSERDLLRDPEGVGRTAARLRQGRRGGVAVRDRAPGSGGIAAGAV